MKNLKTVHSWAISADNQYVMVEEVFVDTYGLKQSFYRVINLITLAHTQVSLNGETVSQQPPVIVPYISVKYI